MRAIVAPGHGAVIVAISLIFRRFLAYQFVPQVMARKEVPEHG
jgi:hypothetical protein